MSDGQDLTFTCPACGHQAVPDHGVQIQRDIVQCSECQTRIAFGVEMPRVAITPDDDKRFVQLHLGKQIVRFDRKYAHLIGLNLISICAP